ncbi:MAG: NADPH-dependent glutamate synthase [Clostridia bacterium]
MSNRVPLTHQQPNQRISNFSEVIMGYSKAEAVAEATRCLNCKKPRCVTGCPVHTNIPLFISCLKEDKLDLAYDVISLTNSLPSVCGRVCPHEHQCEGNCIQGIKGQSIAIGSLERFIADYHVNKLQIAQPVKVSWSNAINTKIAVIGSGPAGLTCASELAQNGYHVTIFEKNAHAGGMLVYGIPKFRLPREVVDKQLEELAELGVEIKTNSPIENAQSLENLRMLGYDAFFIAIGATKPYQMGVEGEQLEGVFTASEYLARINFLDISDNHIDANRVVAVVGGGNTAMDAARCALRQGASKVYCIYRRSEKEMPACKEEIEDAVDEGIDFKFLTNPIRIIGDNGYAIGIECVKMELGELDGSGRPKAIPIKDSNYTISADCIIMALGASPDQVIKQAIQDLQFSPKGTIVADEKCRTNVEGVFAGGDVVNGSATVITAMSAGRTAARSIMEYLSDKYKTEQ